MINYYIEKDHKIVLFNEDKQLIENTILFMPEYRGLEIQVTERPIVDFQFADTEEFKEEQAKKERERIQGLKLTKRIFVLALQEFGITYSQLKELIATNDNALLEWDLCVELERSNPLLDMMAGEMGITPEQLDYIFQKGNGEDVEPPVLPDDIQDIVEEEVTDNEVEDEDTTNADDVSVQPSVENVMEEG